MNIQFGVIVSLLASIIFIRMLIHIAPSLSLVDKPSVRKIHKGDIPIVGGIGIFLAFTIGLISSDVDLNLYKNLFLSLIIIFSLGVIDDIRDLSAGFRIVGHIIAILFLFDSELMISSLGKILFFGEFNLEFFSYFFTIFAIIGCINSVNMTDGIDGLAGMQSLFSVVIISIFAFLNSNNYIFDMSLFLIASLIGFLLFNLNFFGRRYKVFLGDSGTTILGFMLCVFLIIISQGENKIINPITAVWIMALPVIDTLSIILRRIRKGISPFKADREHLHHFFLRLGYSDKKTLFVVLFLSVLFNVIGILFEILNIPEWISFLVFIMIFICYFYIISHAWKVTRKLKKDSTM